MKNLQTYEEFINEAVKTEKWQVIFYGDHGDDAPYTLEYWNSKIEAEKWAESHEYEYDDEWFNPVRHDYEFKTFYRFHNPEDKDSYTGYEVKKIKI